jgi:hypothetical protein
MQNDRASYADPVPAATLHEYGPDHPILAAAVRGARWVDADSGRLAIARLAPEEIRYAADDGIRRTSAQLSGVHLDFETSAEHLDLDLHVTRSAFATAGHRWRPAIVQVEINGVEVDRAELDGGTRILLGADGRDLIEPGSDETVRLQLGRSDSRRIVRIWLPHNAAVDVRGACADAPLAPAAAGTGLRWVHYGSSISHCASADTPLDVWPVRAAESLGWQVSSLGLSGQAMLDPFVARAIASTDADIITLKVGINLVNGAAMSKRTFTPALHGFLDLIRDRHPTTPLIVISPIACPMHETTPGPTVAIDDIARGPSPAPAPVGALTLSSIRSAIDDAVRLRGDAALFALDGRLLLGDADAGHLFDNLHPDTAGYRLMADRFAAIAGSAPWAPPTGAIRPGTRRS